MTPDQHVTVSIEAGLNAATASEIQSHQFRELILAVPDWAMARSTRLARAVTAGKATLNATDSPVGGTGRVLADIVAERHAQNATFGPQDHAPGTWLAILTEEVGELAEAILKATSSDPHLHGTHSTDMRTEAVQVAAVAVAFVECLDRSDTTRRERAVRSWDAPVVDALDRTWDEFPADHGRRERC